MSRKNTPSQEEEDNEKFEVEKLISHVVKDGVDMYCVKWLNYPLSQSTWEPTDNILTASNLITQFWEEKNADVSMQPPYEFSYTFPTEQDPHKNIYFQSEFNIPADPDLDFEPKPFPDSNSDQVRWIHFRRENAISKGHSIKEGIEEVAVPHSSGPTILKIISKSPGKLYVVVQQHDELGYHEEVPFEDFNKLFPDALTDYLETNVIPNLSDCV